MEREVEDFIQNLSDIDLFEYIRCKTHLPEALQFAKVEFAKRKIPQDRVNKLKRELQARIKAREEEIREMVSEPLPCKLRIPVFLSGLCLGIPLLFFVPAWLRFRNEDLEQKCKDMYIFAAIGFVIGVILMLLKVPPWGFVLKLF